MTEHQEKLLIVEDDQGLKRQLRWAFQDYDVHLAGDRPSAMEAVGMERPPVVILDLGLPPDADGPTVGLATLEGILSLAPDTKVIMMTGQSDRAYAVKAVAIGAYDFYQKPVEIDVLNLIVKRAYQLHALEEEHRRISNAVDGPLVPGVITANAEMQRVLEKVRKIALSDAATLIYGESGTGKELLANGMHVLSKRRDSRFVAINSAAIPDQLLESELFGYEKGAFTGAIKTTKGRVELAKGGTLFLDEIGDMDMSLQAKLLRFLQEKVIERVGGRDTIPVDVRVISATNKNLPQLIASGEFREDLYYRLTEFTIEIPPLRDRPDDTVVIANHYLQDLAKSQTTGARSFSSDALAALSKHAWPGNVRELQNRVKRAAITATSSRITPADLELAVADDSPAVETLKEARDRAERQSAVKALTLANGNISKAAKILDVSRPRLYDLIRYHDLKT